MTSNKKKLALVTGGIGGIGTSICKVLADNDITVIANYRRETEAQAWLAARREEGYSNLFIAKANVADFDDVAKMITSIKEEHGTIDILINNAGITKDTSFKKMSFQQWDDVLKSNLYSMFNCTRNVINDMLEQGFGRIINISSINGQKGQFGQTNYSASKAGAHGFTKSLALEVITKGVTVNTISPGYVETEMIKAIPDSYREAILAEIPAKRFGQPSEIAHAILYLLSEQAGFVTGSNLSINGGQHTY